MASLGMDTKAYQTGIKGAERQTGTLTKAIGGLQSRIAALVTVGGFILASRRAIQLGRDMTQAAQQTQTLAREFATLRAMAMDVGSSQETVSRALRNVSTRTEEAVQGNRSYANALQMLGLSASEMVKLPVAQRFEQIAVAVTNASNQTEAMAAASRILGQRAGPELIEVLRSVGSEGLEPMIRQMEKTGRIMTADVAAAMESLDTTTGRLRDRFTVLMATLLARFVPALEKLMNFVNENANALLAAGRRVLFFVAGMKMAGVAVRAYAAGMGVLKAATVGATAAQAGLIVSLRALRIAMVKTGFGIAAIALGEVAARAMKAREEVDDFSKSTDELSQEFRRTMAAVEGVTGSIDELEQRGTTAFSNLKAGIDEWAQSVIEAMDRLEGNETQLLEDRMREILSIMQQQNVTMFEAERILDRRNMLQETDNLLQEQRLKLLELQAAGESEAAKELEGRIKVAEHALKIAKDHNLEMSEALRLAKGIAEQESRRGEDGAPPAREPDSPRAHRGRQGGISDVLGGVPRARQMEALRQAANEIGQETGRRFQRIAGPGGETRFRELVDGRTGRTFTEEQMKSAIDERLKGDDNDSKLLEQIRDALRGKFVNE